MLNRISGKSCGLLILSLTLFWTGCSSSGSSGGPIPVTITDQSGNPLPGTTVVLGDSNGAMKAYGETDANGQITFVDSPANATVTAALSCLRSGTTETTYSLDIKYDVNTPVKFVLNACSIFSGAKPAFKASSSASPGSVTVNVVNTISGVTQNEVFTNYGRYESIITEQTFTMTIYPYQLQSDGKFSLVAIGRDANGSSVGYGTLLDLTFTDGMTATITVDKPVSYVQYSVTNIPSSAGELYADITSSRMGGGVIQLADWRSFSSAPTSTIINVSYIPEFGDRFGYVLGVSHNETNNGARVFSFQNILLSGVTTTSPSNQSFDFNDALSAPSNLTVSGANTATPTLAWSGIDPRATALSVGAQVRLSSTTFYLFANDLSPARASITYPELPDALAAFRPTGVDVLSVSNYTPIDANIYKISGAEYFQSEAPVSAPSRAPRSSDGTWSFNRRPAKVHIND